MKKLVLLSLFCLFILRGVTAQNIYESIGKKAEILTLSEGKYQEIFSNDTVVRIGSVMFNRVTNEVVDFVTNDTILTYAEMDLSTRFLSVDPIGRKYPELTPYQFASNTPIEAIDLDGEEKYNYRLTLDKNGKTNGIVFEKEIKSWFTDLLQGQVHRIVSPKTGLLYEKKFTSGKEASDFVQGKTVAELETINDNELHKIELGAALIITAIEIQNAAAQIESHYVSPPETSPSTSLKLSKLSSEGKSIEVLGKEEMSVVKGGSNHLKPENGYLGGKRHGIKWQESDIKLALNKSNTPIGKWGSKIDLEYAGQKAYSLEPNTGFMDFPINPNTKSKVYLQDGSVVIPDMIRVRNNGNGTFHGFPIDSKTAEPIYKSAEFKKP